MKERLMLVRQLFLITFLWLGVATPALAQSQFATPAGGGNNTAPGHVCMVLNSSGLAVPCSTANPLPITGGGGGGGGTVTQGTGGSSPWLVTSAPYSYTPVTGTQSALAVTTATGLTVPATATFATITPIGGAVNYSIVSDFTPTASNGVPLQVGQTLTLSGASVLAAAKFIDATGSTGTLLVEYTK